MPGGQPRPVSTPLQNGGAWLRVSLARVGRRARLGPSGGRQLASRRPMAASPRHPPRPEPARRRTPPARMR
jgi:hypothetical protein